MPVPLFKDETRTQNLKSLQIYTDQSQIENVLQPLRELIERENTERGSSSNKIWANQVLNFNPHTFEPNEKILGIPIEKVAFPQPAFEFLP